MHGNIMMYCMINYVSSLFNATINHTPIFVTDVFIHCGHGRLRAQLASS